MVGAVLLAMLGAAAQPDLVGQGVALFRQGRIPEAIALLRQAPADSPDLPQARYYLVRSYRLTRQPGRAAQLADDLLRRFPGSAYTHKLLGEAYDAAFQEQEAEREFQQAIQLAPEMPELHFALGMLRWRRGEDVAAAEQFRVERRINPAFPRPAFYLADIDLRGGRPAAAVEHLKAALAIDPNQYDALCQLAKAYEQLNREPEAVQTLERAAKLKPEESTAHYRLSRLLFKAGRVAEAQREQALARRNLDSAKFPETGH